MAFSLSSLLGASWSLEALFSSLLFFVIRVVAVVAQFNRYQSEEEGKFVVLIREERRQDLEA